ncbi:NACHT domain-containing protein [Mycena venus]|uniref:NACHT domain-containing protein n=1 Tax=Mycena venus TaxID=2733690 RepID=A0A8H7DCB0_9AGAR|nr:NACHT domain-containing protein [Mycena venus]
MSNMFSSRYSGFSFDDNAESTAETTFEQDRDSPEFFSAPGQGHPFSGVERNNRRARAARTTPYQSRRSYSSHEPSSSTGPSATLPSFSRSVPIHQLPWDGLPHGRRAVNFNNHIYGGTGGNGGAGVRGQGGDGGAGEGPIVNYYIDEGNINHIHRRGEQGLYILRHAAASDAFHDSADRYPQPKCHPETRTKILEDLWAWSSESDLTSSILWLHGPAGAGKSAIAQSFCHKLEAAGRLGASFFFKRGHPSRGTSEKLFPTIAYQLALCQPELKQSISQIVEDDPSTIDRALAIQLEKLIVKPCRQSILSRNLVVVIDGLDECELRSKGHDNIHKKILESIGGVIHGSENPFPLRFFVASRPEPHIREAFMDTLLNIHRPVNIEQSFNDVWRYLLDEFERIRLEHQETMATIPGPWPSWEITNWLVHNSSGYFIYASTVIKFVDDKDFRPPERLQVILGMKKSDSGSPFAALDALYTQILCAVPRRPLLLKIFAVIAARMFQLSIHLIDQFLELEPGELRLALRGLQSVIGVKKEDDSECNDWSPESKIVVHHASFLDFLQDPARAGIFYVGSSSLQTDLCRHILKALSYSYDDPSLNRDGFVGQ